MREAANKEGRTVLYVSHNMNTIRQLCDRCIVLDKGKIIFDGDVEEAINLYLSTSKALEINNDCKKERTNKSIDGVVYITQVSIQNKDYPVYAQNESIRLIIHFLAKRAIEEAAVRFTVLAEDTTPVGLSTSGKSLRIREGDNSVMVDFFPQNLAPGKYTVKITIYSVNEFGNNQMHDVVDEAFAFERMQVHNENNNMRWNTRWWGYLAFPEIRIMKE